MRLVALASLPGHLLAECLQVEVEDSWLIEDVVVEACAVHVQDAQISSAVKFLVSNPVVFTGEGS